jgi:WD40 repeat protein
VGSGRLLHTLTNGPARALDAQFSPDGMQIASTTDDGMLHLWDAMSGKLLRESETGLSKESAVRFSPDGNFIATAAGTPQQSFGFEGQVKIWSRSDLSALFECPGADAVFNNDGKWVATFVRSEISLRELPSGTSLKRLDAAGPVRQIRISRDSRRILAASLDGNARLLDAASGAVLAVFGHGAPLEDAAFARDESVVVTCAANNTFMAWDAKSGSSLNQLAGRGTTLFTTDFSPDGSRMVTATGDGEFFQVWDPLYQVGRKLLAYGARDYPDFSICEGGGQAALFSYRGLTVFPLDGAGKPVLYAVNPLSRVYRVSVDFSPDGTRMATTLDSNKPSIWKHQSGDFVQLSGHRGPVTKIAFDISGEKVVTASWDRTARIWDAVTGQSSIVFEGHAGGVNTAAFSLDGRQVITASSDATARIWDAQSGQCLHILEGHQGWVSCALFSRDGERAFTASADRTVRVWDSASGRQVGVFQGHGDQVYEITLAAEGTPYLLSSSRDRTSRVWNAATGESLLVLPEVWRARFLSAGPALAVVHRDGRVERWESAPWQRLNPSGTESFEETFAQYRAEDYAEARKTFIPDRGPAQIIMVASDRTLAESLTLLAGALQNEADDTGSLTAPPGLKLDPGPRSAALHALGFEENDTLLQLDGKDLSGRNQAVGLLNEILSRVESQPSTNIEMLIERQGKRVPVRLLTRPRVESSAKVTLNRGESAGLTREILSALMFDRASGITSDAVLKAYAQIGAGFRVQMHDEWTSLWLKAGLAPEDRLIKVEGEGITDCDDALARLNRLSADVAGQKVNAFSLDLQRGDFATIHVDYSIQ